jgi:hypothetical protein
MNPLSIIQVATRTATTLYNRRDEFGSEGVSLDTRETILAEAAYEKAHHPVRYAWKNSIQPALISICLVLLVVGGIIGVGALGIYLLGH